ncbi:MAG: dihydroneopterin aldolase [Bacteroidales bacterium]|nr:dihydroneopterin aldolase [Bacteroidales bacterium]
MALIRLNGMQFYAYHGCFAEERKIGTRFVADVELQVDTSEAQLTDEITSTVSYLEVYQLVKKEMDKPSHLLENVVSRIADTLLQQFARIEQVTVRLSKLAPPLGGPVASASVEITVKR